MSKLFLLLLILAIANSNPNAALAKTHAHETHEVEHAVAHEKQASQSHLVVNAPPKQVYESIIKLRLESNNKIREVENKGSTCLIEEKFDNLPVIGKAFCVYKETYIPYKIIEYSMVNSDKFKAFEGRWNIAPANNGNHTMLTLTTYIDVDIKVPFAKQLTKIQTMSGVKRRLKAVKELSETKKLSAATAATL